jgi:outer membrane protein assembly factor BamE (lipoprotein component of BamABCDE complex)
MRKITQSFLPIVASAFLLSACMSVGNSQVRDSSNLSSVREGVTTQQQIIQIFGQPQSVVQKSDGTLQWHYHHTDVEMSSSMFIPILGPFIGNSSTDMQMLVFNFNRNGTVRSYESTNTQTHMDGLQIR